MEIRKSTLGILGAFQSNITEKIENFFCIFEPDMPKYLLLP